MSIIGCKRREPDKDGIYVDVRLCVNCALNAEAKLHDCVDYRHGNDMICFFDLDPYANACERMHVPYKR